MIVVTSSPSRTSVHHDCSVYMALPSDSSAITRRSRHATAAPTATGKPWPIAPPVRQSQSCGVAPAEAPAAKSPDVLPSSETIAPSGNRAPSDAQSVCAVSAPVGRSGRARGWSADSAETPSSSTRAASAAALSSVGPASVWMSLPAGASQLGLSGYAKNDTGAFASTSTMWRAPSSCFIANSARYATRSTAVRPAPRSMRAGNVSQRSFESVASAIARARARLPARHAVPPTSMSAGSSERSASAAARKVLSFGMVRGRGVCFGATWPPSLHEMSAGRMSVATWPGGPYAAATASAASAPTSSVLADQRMKVETLRATVSMSDSSCASYGLWYVAWSPTMLTTGVCPLRALCRFARPLPRPGPRCSSVAAGRSAMRPKPSAAPVATPSKSASTPCISGTASSAATKCISDVPGFMKHVSTPLATSVRMSAWAPFTFSPHRRSPRGRRSCRG